MPISRIRSRTSWSCPPILPAHGQQDVDQSLVSASKVVDVGTAHVNGLVPLSGLDVIIFQTIEEPLAYNFWSSWILIPGKVVSGKPSDET